MSEEPKEIKEPFHAAALWLAIYIPVNFGCLYLPFIPSVLTGILWGILLPVVFGLSTFFFVQQYSEEFSGWWKFGVFFLLAYGALGTVSLRLVFGA